jgi:hypothetical protein
MVLEMQIEGDALAGYGSSAAACSSKNLHCRFFPMLAWLPLPPCLDQQPFPSSPGL